MLENVKPGDAVGYKRTDMDGNELVYIVKVQGVRCKRGRTLILVQERQFDVLGYEQIDKGQSRLNAAHICPVTPEIRAAAARRRMLERIKGVNLNKLTDSALKEISDILIKHGAL
jgi:hypothetical protein